MTFCRTRAGHPSVAVFFLALMAASTTSATAQSEFKGRLPNHYRRVVVDEQRAKIYAIQRRYHQELHRPGAVASRLKQQRRLEIEAVLTPSQHRRLAALTKLESKPSEEPPKEFAHLETAAADWELAIVDSETTGLDATEGRIVEIGVVICRGGKVLAKKSWLIDPGVPIPASATDVHGITAAMVAGKPTFKQVYPEFVRFIGSRDLIAHNSSFDVRFLAAEIDRHRLEPPGNVVLDSLRLFRRWYPDLKSHRLGDVCRHLGVPIGTEHRAVADSLLLGSAFHAALRAKMPDARQWEVRNLHGKSRRIAKATSP